MLVQKIWWPDPCAVSLPNPSLCHAELFTRTHSLPPSLPPSFIHPCFRSVIHLSIHPYIQSFTHSFIHLIIHSSIQTLTHSFIHSLTYSFIHTYNPLSFAAALSKRQLLRCGCCCGGKEIAIGQCRPFHTPRPFPSAVVVIKGQSSWSLPPAPPAKSSNDEVPTPRSNVYSNMRAGPHCWLVHPLHAQYRVGDHIASACS